MTTQMTTQITTQITTQMTTQMTKLDGNPDDKTKGNPGENDNTG
jgi:hypothetical protein